MNYSKTLYAIPIALTLTFCAAKTAPEDIHVHIKKWEGGYSNKVNDRGGETMMGVTWETYKHIAPRLKMKVTKEAFLALTDADQKRFVNYFFNTFEVDKIKDTRLQMFFVETYWGGNGFMRDLVKYWNTKYAINLELGDKNTGYEISDDVADFINSQSDVDEFLTELFFYKIEWLGQKVTKDRTQQEFLAGWINRTISLKQLLLN